MNNAFEIYCVQIYAYPLVLSNNVYQKIISNTLKITSPPICIFTDHLSCHFGFVGLHSLER